MKGTYKYVSQDPASELSYPSTCIEDTESVLFEERPHEIAGIQWWSHTTIPTRLSHI